ncbi:MAG: hypothetical protein SFZ23_08560 [Planctomycetota bacterium]|nr:hypothetical protein [Planctomycetota bacterium]
MQLSRMLGVMPVALVSVATMTASAQIIIPANNLGTDGGFNPFQNTTVALGAAAVGSWQQAGDGRGVYDQEKWAVIYKYTSVSIPANVTVRFANHPSGAPVVWLVSGDVTINGSIDLSGTNGSSFAGNPPGGPGGFSGGKGIPSPRSDGFGPGGGGQAGNNAGEGGGYGTFGVSQTAGEVGGYVYGTAELIPLMGGSGGGGSGETGNLAGGGGGGAILIVATGRITVNGSIIANGGSASGGCCNSSGGGSGGGIRLVSDTLTGSTTGALSAVGGSTSSPGGFGRIRTEANVDSLPALGNPVRSRATVGTTAKLWPDASAPKVTAVSLGNKPLPSDPRGLFTFGNTDVELNSATPAVLQINCENVPLNATVQVRIVPVTQNQNETRIDATFQSGSFTSSTWRATLPISDGVSAFSVSVIMP